MAFYRFTIRDWFRHVKAELFFNEMPSAGRLQDALAAHSICRDLEGRQAFRTRYKPALKDPRLDPRGPAWRYIGSSIEVLLEHLDVG